MSDYPNCPRWWFFQWPCSSHSWPDSLPITPACRTARPWLPCRRRRAPPRTVPVCLPVCVWLAPALGIRIRPALLHPVLLSPLQRLLGLGRAMAAALVL